MSSTVSPHSAVTDAYDTLAPGYDASVTGAQWVRERLWARMAQLFPRGARVLDVTAGTGLDAAFLAGRGVCVVAADRSPRMLAQLRSKTPSIPTCALDFNHLCLAPEPAFEGVISTFAGLNTAADLGGFARAAARLLRPRGVLFVHLLNRWPALDLLRQLARLRGRQAWRTVTSARRSVQLGGVDVVHYLYSPGALYCRAFAPDFHLSRIEGYGLLRPVDARWGGGLDGLDRRLSGCWPFYSLGAFFALEMVRRDTQP